MEPSRQIHQTVSAAGIVLRSLLKNETYAPDRRAALLAALEAFDTAEAALYDALPPHVEGDCRCSEPDGGHWSWCPAFVKCRCLELDHREYCPERVAPR